LQIVSNDVDEIGQEVGPVRVKAIGNAVLVTRNQKVRWSGHCHLERPARIAFQERQFVSAEVTALFQFAAGGESNARHASAGGGAFPPQAPHTGKGYLRRFPPYAPPTPPAATRRR